jgi:hypothetical protein
VLLATEAPLLLQNPGALQKMTLCGSASVFDKEVMA